MVRRIGETAEDYARRTRPQREGESQQAYEARIATEVSRVEMVHGDDNEKFMAGPDGKPVLKESLANKKVIPGEVISEKSAIESPKPAKPEGTGQIG